MEFTPAISLIFDRLRNQEDYVVIDGAELYKYTTEELEDFIDLLGEESRKARKLSKPVTSSVQLHKDQFLYLKTSENKVTAFVKIQKHKKIFKNDDFGGMNYSKATAVMDLFVHPIYQTQETK